MKVTVKKYDADLAQDVKCKVDGFDVPVALYGETEDIVRNYVVDPNDYGAFVEVPVKNLTNTWAELIQLRNGFAILFYKLGEYRSYARTVVEYED